MTRHKLCAFLVDNYHQLAQPGAVKPVIVCTYSLPANHKRPWTKCHVYFSRACRGDCRTRKRNHNPLASAGMDCHDCTVHCWVVDCLVVCAVSDRLQSEVTLDYCNSSYYFATLVSSLARPMYFPRLMLTTANFGQTVQSYTKWFHFQWRWITFNPRVRSPALLWPLV